MSSEKFMNKYRIASARKPGWDYSSDGVYFITICTAGRICWFGNIENQKMIYSEIGKMVLHEWEKSFILRAELFCDAFVIMPNHIHGLLRIHNDGFNRRDARPCVPTNETPTVSTGIAKRQPKSISSFVAGFKSAATTIIRQTDAAFAWQPRFHDHIVRNDAEYQRIFNYISNNPKKWETDTFRSE